MIKTEGLIRNYFVFCYQEEAFIFKAWTFQFNNCILVLVLSIIQDQPRGGYEHVEDIKI